MNDMQRIAAAIPHDYRQKILIDWLPNASASMANKSFVNLFNAYFIYVDPNAVKKSDCPKCLGNILKNWRSLKPVLVEAEQEYNLINEL